MAERSAKVAGGEVVRLKRRRASEDRPALGLREAGDLVLDETARPDEEEDDHRLRKEREEHGRDGVGDVPGDEQARLGVGRGQVRGQGEALHRGQKEAGEGEDRARQKRDRHRRQSL